MLLKHAKIIVNEPRYVEALRLVAEAEAIEKLVVEEVKVVESADSKESADSEESVK